MESERRSQRYPSHRPLQLRCETWNEFVSMYGSDICRGGMFIQTDDAPEPLSNVELKLMLPAGTEVTLSARVVHVVTKEQAELHGRVAGMGVEFIHADAEQKRQILQLVEFARSQDQADADPEASFHRALLESSTSLPASEVAARLSALPDAALGGEPSARPRSRMNMPAVRLDGTESEPAHPEPDPRGAPAVRPPPRPPSAPLDPNSFRQAGSKPIVRGQTGPLTAATARSSTNIPAVRGQTGPLTAATARSSTNIPVVRSPTGPLDAANSRSSARNPIVRTPTGPLAPTSNTPGQRPATGPISQPETGGPASGQPARGASGPISTPAAGSVGPETTPSGQPLPPPKPTDLNRLKLVLNALNHKHFEDAARMTREMLVDNPGDPQVLKWQAICFARMAIARNDPAAAVPEYEKALRYDEHNREAREFVKNYQRDKKLSALPFGRYFTKKK